jgi:2-methylcitrate dehydratase PrpD
LNKRHFLKLAGGSAAGAVWLRSPAAEEDVVMTLSHYIANAAAADLPPDVLETAKRHILDTLAAMVSGSKLIPGQLALKYIRDQGGVPQAQVAGTRMRTSAVNAAFVNGMMAHADETDDSHRASLIHPGAAITPAALAVAEASNAGGGAFLKSVVLGYDMGCRTVLALQREQMLRGSGAAPGIGGCVGAACAAAAAAGLPADRVPYMLAYAVQQAAGVNSWTRDEEHVEKAFVFAGAPARNGVTAVEVVRAGFTGESEPLSGPDNFLDAFSGHADPSQLTNGLGRRYEITLTDMKRYPVGFPIQPAIDALQKLIAGGLRPTDLRSLVVRLPAPGVHTVDNRSMPDVNVQYIMAAMLIDGALSFDIAHSLQRMKDPRVLELKQRITLVEDTDLTAQKRTRDANLEATKTDGTIVRMHGVTAGAYETPMSREDVESKSRELLTPILGRDRTQRLISMAWNLEQVPRIRELTSLLSA